MNWIARSCPPSLGYIVGLQPDSYQLSGSLNVRQLRGREPTRSYQLRVLALACGGTVAFALSYYRRSRGETADAGEGTVFRFSTWRESE